MIGKYLSLVKFSHTIFALPFAILGFFIASHESPNPLSLNLFILIVLSMVFARSAAMAFNRYIDRDIDKLNPRTAVREIPAGKIKPKAALLFVVGNCLLFVITAYFINPLCFYLSPLALAIVLGYSLTKRYTFLCHFILGIGLSLAPLGAYLAVTGSFDLLPFIYALAVFLWVAGFDIIYALQDEDFDKSNDLHSVPVILGTRKSLFLSNVLHFITALLILFTAYLMQERFMDLQYLHWLGAGLFIGLLFYQHTLVKENDLSRINLAFFTTNGIASIVLGVMVILDFYI